MAPGGEVLPRYREDLLPWSFPQTLCPVFSGSRARTHYHPGKRFFQDPGEEFAMPIHDWTRVRANRFHDFHQSWTIALRNALNAGPLPPGTANPVLFWGPRLWAGGRAG